MTIEQLQQPVQKQFLQYKEEYHHYTQNQIPLLHEVEQHLAQQPGKQIRPLLLLLTAKACGHLSYNHILLAATVELLHNATLMHDDVVDESNTRRGQESVRHRWGNQTAVLCGDYYLSLVMTILHRIGNPLISKLVAQTVSTMCKGELLQLTHHTDKNTTIETYIEIIGSKTASLMALCCHLGAISTQPPNEHQRKALQQFGYHYGLVFQIRDDTLDEQNPHDIGLPQGFQPQAEIDKHTHLAQQALLTLPPSPARQALGNLLLFSAPSPDKQTTT